MSRPTLFLTVGLPGTGKTTEARRIEVERGALRLTKDEWMKSLYGTVNPSWASDVIEGRLVEVGLRALELSDEELAHWAGVIDVPTAGELDGTEPIDRPPPGFRTWDEWRTHRWPPSVD